MEEVPDSGNTKVKGEQLGVARKRLRSTGSGGSAVVPGKPEHQGEKLSAKSSRNEKVPNLVHVEKVQPEASPPDLKKVRHLFTRLLNRLFCIAYGIWSHIFPPIFHIFLLKYVGFASTVSHLYICLYQVVRFGCCVSRNYLACSFCKTTEFRSAESVFLMGDGVLLGEL